jgi:hypothetical protein
MTWNKVTKGDNTILLGTSFFANAARPKTYAAAETSHLIIATFSGLHDKARDHPSHR